MKRSLEVMSGMQALGEKLMKKLLLLGLVLFLGVIYAEDEKETKEEPNYPVLDTVIKKATKKEGFFTLYLEENELFLEVKTDFLDQEFYFFSSLTGGHLSEFVPNYTLDQKVLYFRKIGRSLGLFEKSLYYTAEKDSPESLAVKQAYLDDLIFMFPIRAASEDESAYLVELNSWLFSVERFFPSWIRQFYTLVADAQRSFWTITKAFPDNVELEVQSTYAAYNLVESAIKSNQLRLYYSLVRKKESDYKPRVADERIGYFLNEVRDFSDLLKDQGYRRYINRWNVQKAVPKAKHSVVKKPIIYYIDKTVPYKYWQYIREGVLEWNKAFEKLGFLGAIEVRLPSENSDWDTMDIRYSTISWVADEASWAMGPSRVDPWTGEILCADIIVTAGYIDYYDYFTKLYGNLTVNGRLSAEKYVQLEEELAEYVRHGAHVRYHDIYRDLGRKLTIMSAQTSMPLGSEEFEKWRDELIGAALKDTVTHEVGHTLGLRHNFKGTSTVSTANLRDKDWTLANQISDSVMDYADWNITLEPANQGAYTMTSIGRYDYLAIEYGYKPLEEENEAEELHKIASSLRQQGLEYGTDEDVWSGIDPLCQAWDIGDDLVDSAIERIEVLRKILSSVDRTIVTTGDNYFMIRRSVNSLLWEYNNKISLVLAYIGGVYTRKDRVNDEGGLDPFTPVSLSQQQKTIDFIENYVFGEKKLIVPERLLHKLRSDPWRFSRNNVLEIDFILNFARELIIYRAFSARSLNRILEYHEKVSGQSMTIKILFERFYQIIFANIDQLSLTNNLEISASDMESQRTFLERLISILYDNRGKREIVLYARHCVDLLKADIDSALQKLSGGSRFAHVRNIQHLRDLRNRIEEYERTTYIKYSTDVY